MIDILTFVTTDLIAYQNITEPVIKKLELHIIGWSAGSHKNVDQDLVNLNDG